jgi:hypothetical protein
MKSIAYLKLLENDEIYVCSSYSVRDSDSTAQYEYNILILETFSDLYATD